jgi:hypothetical protein
MLRRCQITDTSVESMDAEIRAAPDSQILARTDAGKVEAHM